MKRLSVFSIVFPLFVLMLALSAQPIVGAVPQSGGAQGGQTQAKPAPTPTPAPTTTEQSAIEQPADFKAFNEAAKTPEAAKRIEALQKFVKDYPDSVLKANAESQIRSQALNQAADFTKRYQAAIEQSIRSAKGLDLVQTYTSAANELNRAGILLEQAEEYALKALQYNDVQKYIADFRAGRPSATAKLPPNTTLSFTMTGGVMTANLVARTQPASSGPSERTDDDLRTMFRSQRAQLQTTLGQIYFKRGKTAEAEKTMKAVYSNPDTPSASKVAAARGLADVARKAGDTKSLVDYLVVMAVSGAAPDVHQELRDVYQKTHNGSLDGLDAMLDERFHASVKPLHVTPFARPKASNPRMVLAELFTGAACPPCVGADMAFDAVLERYSRQDVAFIVYHEHIPGPDPMTNPATQARGAKDGLYTLGGVPTFAIDGVSTVGGGGADAAERIFKEVSEIVEKRMAIAPEAGLNVKAKVVGSTIRVTAEVGKITSKSDKLKLQIALVEEIQRYSGPNGVRFHPMVVRSLAGVGFKGFQVPAARGLKVEHVFDVEKILADNKKAIDEFLSKPFRRGPNPSFTEGRRDEIDANRLMIVAFVQDEDTAQKLDGSRPNQLLRKVLQSAFVKVPAAAKKSSN